MLMLARRARGHFVTLIEIRVHLIRVKPGHISVWGDWFLVRGNVVATPVYPGFHVWTTVYCELNLLVLYSVSRDCFSSNLIFLTHQNQHMI